MCRRIFALLFFASVALHAEEWGPLQFLVGDWVGESSQGQPGQASGGSFSFAPELQGTILVRKSFAEYPAAEGRPAFRHEDLTIVYRNSESKEYRATYWDNEGHVIQYAVSPAPEGVVMTSDGPATTPRYRLTYTAAGKDRVKIKFEIAPPGQDFTTYLESSAKRKK